MALARIGLGSNDGNAAGNVEAAIRRLAELGVVVARSRLYHTRPWGVRDQPDFVNAAALLETKLSPRDLLEGLKRLERELGRVETYRWGPRAIDLDILTYDDADVDESDLVIPHPHLHERAFVLVPLAEIDPSFEAAAAGLDPAARAEVEPLT